MWWLGWIAVEAQAAGCRGAISDAIAAWDALAVPVPAATAAVPALNATLDVIGEHAAVAQALRASRRASGRGGLATAVVQALDWLDANDRALGAAPARAAVTAARDRCG